MVRKEFLKIAWQVMYFFFQHTTPRCQRSKTTHSRAVASVRVSDTVVHRHDSSSSEMVSSRKHPSQTVVGIHPQKALPRKITKV